MTLEKLKISESSLNQFGPGRLSTAMHLHNECALPHPSVATTHRRTASCYTRSQCGTKRTMLLLSITLLVFVSPKATGGSIVSFFSADDLRYTFGVDHISKVPPHREFYPSAVYSEADWDGPKPPLLRKLIIELEEGDGALHLEFHPSSRELVAPRGVTVVERNRPDGGGKLIVHTDWPDRHNCHFQHTSNNHTYAAVSNCDQNLKGVIVHQGRIYVIHPIPERHMSKRTRRSVGLGADGSPELGLHVIYKRAAVPDQGGEFCGVDAGYSRQELMENEAGVHEDAFVLGQRLTRDSDLVVELAVFVDENLWRHFSSKHGSYASQKLQEYALTMLNNIQIMYNQPSPPLTFRIVRYEVYQSQPSPIAPHLHDNGHAQRYLDVFCRYQRSLGTTDWDHALMLTGHDIHRGGGATSISGIARLDGMCDPWNTCTLAEGMDFTSAFIGTHELGHSVGMRHDEPYCASNYIMSSSLGPGKVTWSPCSIRDFQSFIQRLDGRGKNCLRNAFQREQLPLSNPLKPGQIYDAHRQCSLMHGTGYIQISPRQDHPNGICNMMWCGQGQFGRIITSHPALEGTSCGQNMWCQLGRCVPFSGFGTPLTTPVPPPLVVGGYTTPPPPSPPPPPPTLPTLIKRVDGGWSQWRDFTCQQCSCSPIIGALGVTLSQRTCNNPAPQNGGSECKGSPQRAAICNRRCSGGAQTVDQYISAKCSEHKRLKNDAELTGAGSQLERFPQRACKVYCDVVNAFGSMKNYRFYGDNLPDGAPCGANKYCLAGECLDPTCEYSTLNPIDVTICPAPRERCPLTAPPPPNEPLPIPNQPPPGGDATQWSEWAAWSQCSVSCGRGSQNRQRQCTTATSTIAFSCPGMPTDTQSCDGLPCLSTSSPPTGEWTEWGVWSECSRLCGAGVRSHSRICKGAQGTCPGQAIEQSACNEQPCYIPPVANSVPPPVGNNIAAGGEWTQWASWSTCSVTCGAGIRKRTRVCQGGQQCPDESSETEMCSEANCPVSNAQWGGWGFWSPCSETCGPGYRRRLRKCYGSGPCSGSEFEREDCNSRSC